LNQIRYGQIPEARQPASPPPRTKQTFLHK
jgi:hypothetical protein